jgi:phosphoribosylformylglycinamidine (FGAM) synthase-like enzyme
VGAVSPEAPSDGTLHRSLGLTDAEAESITQILGRPPNHLELAMYAVMWSEHCSYKSSRIHLRRLPTEGPGVLVGPGENAGVVDLGDGIAAAIRIESHNHPSAVEPYQGAATGVGGIIRDIFTMGARPVALMDPLFFGTLEDARSRWIFEGVVSGISGYGNSVGVPTVGGELTFSRSYSRNPLVNVLCLGLMPTSRVVLGRATGEGNLAVLLGSTTGRDGIGGVSVLASAGFADEAEADSAKRPSVQVADPFEEKRLIEACLELLDRGLVVGIQDLGGGGLTCATSETAARAGMGMDVYVGEVALREPGMEPFEVMTSESQERMLAIVTPDALAEVEEVCSRWEVRARVVGLVTAPEPRDAPREPDHAGQPARPGHAGQPAHAGHAGQPAHAGHPGQPGHAGQPGDGTAAPGALGGEATGMLRIFDRRGGEELARVPAASLSEDAPLYDRPMNPPADIAARARDDPGLLEPSGDCGPELLALLSDSSWVYSQYDHQLFLNTVVGPGADATVLRVAGPGIPKSGRGLALSTDSNPRWCAVDPRIGTASTVAESALNVACAGAKPLALVNCLNFGNPEHPEVMWQLSEAVDGMAEACSALGIPVVGGNVSLYNESGGEDIDPTPVVAVLGVIESLDRVPAGPSFAPDSDLVLLGERSSSLSGSRWAVELHGHRGGRLVAVDYYAHRALLGLVAELVATEGLVLGVHDVSAGGLAVAAGECAVASGTGCDITDVHGHGELFSESPGRVLVCTRRAEEVTARAGEAAVGAEVIGSGGGDQLRIGGLVDLPVASVVQAWQRALPSALAVPA